MIKFIIIPSLIFLQSTVYCQTNDETKDPKVIERLNEMGKYLRSLKQFELAATSAVIGDTVDSTPSDCDQRVVSGITYTKCGEVWYKPMYNGTDVQYEVVKSPL